MRWKLLELPTRMDVVRSLTLNEMLSCSTKLYMNSTDEERENGPRHKPSALVAQVLGVPGRRIASVGTSLLSSSYCLAASLGYIGIWQQCQS